MDNHFQLMFYLTCNVLILHITRVFGGGLKQALIVTKKNNTVISEEAMIGFVDSCQGDNESQTTREDKILDKIELLLARQTRLEELILALQPNESRQGRLNDYN